MPERLPRAQAEPIGAVRSLRRPGDFDKRPTGGHGCGPSRRGPARPWRSGEQERWRRRRITPQVLSPPAQLSAEPGRSPTRRGADLPGVAELLAVMAHQRRLRRASSGTRGHADRKTRQGTIALQRQQPFTERGSPTELDCAQVGAGQREHQAHSGSGGARHGRSDQRRAGRTADRSRRRGPARARRTPRVECGTHGKHAGTATRCLGGKDP